MRILPWETLVLSVGVMVIVGVGSEDMISPHQKQVPGKGPGTGREQSLSEGHTPLPALSSLFRAVCLAL